MTNNNTADKPTHVLEVNMSQDVKRPGYIRIDLTCSCQLMRPCHWSARDTGMIPAADVQAHARQAHARAGI